MSLINKIECEMKELQVGWWFGGSILRLYWKFSFTFDLFPTKIEFVNIIDIESYIELKCFVRCDWNGHTIMLWYDGILCITGQQRLNSEQQFYFDFLDIKKKNMSVTCFFNFVKLFFYWIHFLIKLYGVIEWMEVQRSVAHILGEI